MLVVVVLQFISPGEAGIGKGIVWVDFPRQLEKITRGCIVFTGEFIIGVPAFRNVIIGGEAIRVFPGHACGLGFTQLASPSPECSGDGPRDVVTNGEDVVDLPVIAVNPDLLPRSGIDQLRRYAHVLIGALYAALDDVMNIEVLSHLSHLRRLVLVCQGRIANHDDQLGKLGQPRDQLLGNSIGKVLLVVSGTHVVIGQDWDCRFGARKSAAQKGISGSAAFKTQYVDRGLTNSAEHPAVQPEFDLTYKEIFYAGIWGSNVDFGSGPNGQDLASIEIDYYAGITPTLGKWKFDIAAY